MCVSIHVRVCMSVQYLYVYRHFIKIAFFTKRHKIFTGQSFIKILNLSQKSWVYKELATNIYIFFYKI